MNKTHLSKFIRHLHGEFDAATKTDSPVRFRRALAREHALLGHLNFHEQYSYLLHKLAWRVNESPASLNKQLERCLLTKDPIVKAAHIRKNAQSFEDRDEIWLTNLEKIEEFTGLQITMIMQENAYIPQLERVRTGFYQACEERAANGQLGTRAHEALGKKLEAALVKMRDWIERHERGRTALLAPTTGLPQ